MSILNNKIINNLIQGDLPKIIFLDKDERREEITSEIASRLKLHSVDVVSFRSEEGVAKLREKIKLLNITTGASHKIFVLFDAENLNDEQANTLLKTLEEPPSYAKIYLFSQSINRILPTIRSRCQKAFLSKASSQGDCGLLEIFEKKDFNAFCRHLKNIENEQIKSQLTAMLAQIKKKGLNKNTAELYKRACEALITINCTNVNRKLMLENIFIWWKARAT